MRISDWSSDVCSSDLTGAAAEMVGVGQGAMDMTVNYLKERKQFGKLIGEFQALQHRAAHLYGDMEVARATVMKAQQPLDEGSEGARSEERRVGKECVSTCR